METQEKSVEPLEQESVEPKAEGAVEPKAPRRMVDVLRAHRDGYQATKAYSGKASLHNGDEVALALAGCTPQVALAAAQAVADHLGTEVDLEAKYVGSGGWAKPRLNVGQIRMNSGNRVRGAVKREDISQAEAIAFIEAAAA